MFNPKNFNRDIKELNESDLNKISGGETEAEGGRIFFKNSIFTTCDTCGAECYIKLAKKDIGKWQGMGHANTGAYQVARTFWTCKKCGRKNYTIVSREGGLFLPNPFAHWSGHTFSEN